MIALGERRRAAVTGWEHQAARRFAGLAVSRAVAQVLALAWFLYAAREMSEEQFGVLATGLLFFAVFAGIADGGITRSIVRYVGADPSTLPSAFRSGVTLRVAWGLGATVVGVVLVGALDDHVRPLVVALAGLCATISGVTELGFAALRSIGASRVEATFLVAERVLFLAVAVPLVHAGASAIALLWVYAASNLVSAIVAAVATVQVPVGAPRELPRFMDREAWVTAAGFAILVATPRISGLLVVLTGTSTAAAAFAAGHRPAEALGIFALSVSAPLLAIVRGDVAHQRDAQAAVAAESVGAITLLAVAPMVTWMIVAPQSWLSILYGAERFHGAPAVVRMVAIIAVGLSVRGVAEALLLGAERAGAFLRIVGLGAAVNLALGVPLTLARGLRGAAFAVLVAEVAMLVFALHRAPALRVALWRSVLPLAVVAALAASGALLTSGGRVPMMVSVSIAYLAAAAFAWPRLRALDHRHA